MEALAGKDTRKNDKILSEQVMQQVWGHDNLDIVIITEYASRGRN